jgi:hypothetical protein
MNSQTGNTMGSNGGGNGNPNGSRARRLFRRGPWENASAIVIGLGIVMLMQPFALELYTYSFDVILVGTVGFLITSHFRE